MLPYSSISMENIVCTSSHGDLILFFISFTQSTSYAYVIELDLGTPPQRVTYYLFTKKID